MIHWIDSHAHIYMPDFDRDRDSMLSDCQQQGIKKIYMPNVDVASIVPMMRVEQNYPNYCIAMMGLHPCAVKAHFERDLYRIEDWLSKRAFAAIGEIGLDLYRDTEYIEQQKEAFIIQIEWSKKYNLPIVVHCRNAIDETLALIAAHCEKKVQGVFHCFTGSLEQANKIIDLGFYVGIGGVSTFKNSTLNTIIPHLPIERVLLETDSPYLRPAPDRGKRNDPSCIPIIAHKVALLKQITDREVATAGTANATRLFAL